MFETFDYRQVRAWRCAKGLSMLRLAELLGVSKMHLCRIERGEITPRPDLVRKIKALMGEAKREVIAEPEIPPQMIERLGFRQPCIPGRA